MIVGDLLKIGCHFPLSSFAFVVPTTGSRVPERRREMLRLKPSVRSLSYRFCRALAGDKRGIWVKYVVRYAVSHQTKGIQDKGFLWL
jgi:hypothetical protein